MSTAQEVHSTRMTGVLTVVPFRGCNYFVALLPLRVLKPITRLQLELLMMGTIATFCINIQLTVSFVQVLCKKSLSDYNNLNCQTSEKNIKLIVNLGESFDSTLIKVDLSQKGIGLLLVRIQRNSKS